MNAALCVSVMHNGIFMLQLESFLTVLRCYVSIFDAVSADLRQKKGSLAARIASLDPHKRCAQECSLARPACRVLKVLYLEEVDALK